MFLKFSSALPEKFDKNRPNNEWYNGDYPGGSYGKASTCNAGHPGSIPGLGRCPGEGNGDPLQCSCLGNSMNRGAL